MFQKGPALFGEYSLFTVQIMFSSYIMLHGLPNVLQHSVSKQRAINLFFFFPSLISLVLILILSCFLGISNPVLFFAILFGSIIFSIINIHTIGSQKYFLNLILTIAGNLWMPLVMLLDIFYSVDLDFILNIWSLNSVLILIFSSIYFIQIRIYKNFIFNPNVSDLLNIISNTLLGLPFELLRYIERNFFSSILSETIFGVYSFIAYFMSSIQGIFIRTRNQFLINKISDDQTQIKLIQIYKKSIINLFLYILIPYALLMFALFSYYGLSELNYLYLLLFPYIYNLIFNLASGYLISIELFSNTYMKTLFFLLITSLIFIVFLVISSVMSLNLSISLLLLCFFALYFLARFLWKSNNLRIN